MKKKVVVSVLLSLAVLGAALAYGQNFNKLKGLLSGGEEVPVVVTTGNGTFRAVISKDETKIDYELSYSDLQSTAAQAHIHVGQPNVNGAIVVWLCGNPNPPAINPPAGTQTCPPSGTITGTITGANIVGPASQGVTNGEMDDLITAIRDGNTYVNVHTAVSPGGEIRSQIGPGKGKDKDKDNDHDHH
jgi:CHRD domain-containing protein